MSKKRHWLFGVLAAGLMLAGCGTQTTGWVQVEGKVLDLCGRPLAYKTVFVPGHEPVLTAEDGSFAIANVARPYDLVINNASLMGFDQDFSLVVYRGLTKSDPVVWVNDTTTWDDNCARATVTGAITAPETEVTDLSYGAGVVLGPYRDGDRNTDNLYDLSLEFDPDLAGDAALYGLQWQIDPETSNAVDFLAAGKATVTLADGDALEQDLVLEAIGSRTLSARADLPEAVQVEGLAHYPVADGQILPLTTARLDGDAADENGVYNLVGPLGAGWGSAVELEGSYGGINLLGSAEAQDLANIAGWVWAWAQAPEGSDEVSVGVPGLLVPTAPMDGATIDPEMAFIWSGPEGALYDVVLMLEQSGPDISIEVLTTDTSLKLPDLRDLGLVYDNAWGGRWWVAALGGEAVPASVDDAASDGALEWMVPYFFDYVPVGSWGYGLFADAGEFAFPEGGLPK